jgi:small subunit ribosomal protein S29
MMAYQLLQRLLTVNHAALSDLTTEHELELERKPTLPAGTPLPDLINVGLKDQTVAPIILNTLLSELGEQTA